MKLQKDRIIGRTRHIPERTCVGCRAKRVPEAFLRLACTPEGDIFPVSSRHLPGRGAYVCYDLMCIQQALKPGKLAAAFRRPVTIPTYIEFCRAVLQVLSHRLGSYVSLAHKAGGAISGSTPLRIAMAQHTILYLVLAEDIAASRAGEYCAWCTQHGVPLVTLCTKTALGRLIGKSSRSAIGLSAPQFRDLIAPTATFFTTLRAALNGSAAPDDYFDTSSLMKT